MERAWKIMPIRLGIRKKYKISYELGDRVLKKKTTMTVWQLQIILNFILPLRNEITRNYEIRSAKINLISDTQRRVRGYFR